MNTFDTIVKFFQDCGWFIYPSLLIMASGLSIAIERFIVLMRARAENRKVWDRILPMLQGGKFQQVLGYTTKSDTAIGKIVSNGLNRLQTARRREDIDAAMEEGMMEIVPRLEKRTHYIATFANVITLVGLLGTISGLINNTAFALAVAIPFLLIHSFLMARAGEIVDSLEAAKISFLNMVQSHSQEVRGAH